MSGTDQHDIAACARALQSLRIAPDRVATLLSADLARECELAMDVHARAVHESFTSNLSADDPVELLELLARIEF